MIGEVFNHYFPEIDVPVGSGWLPILCPFHADNNPSASINHQLDAFNCFTCGASGDAIKIVRKVEECDFKSAINKIAEITGTDLDLSFPASRKPRGRPPKPKRFRGI